MQDIEKVKTTYAVKAGFYYGCTILLIGFAIVALVQGFYTQGTNNLPLALLHYIGAAVMIIFSYFFHERARYKMHVLHMSRR